MTQKQSSNSWNQINSHYISMLV